MIGTSLVLNVFVLLAASRAGGGGGGGGGRQRYAPDGSRHTGGRGRGRGRGRGGRGSQSDSNNNKSRQRQRHNDSQQKQQQQEVDVLPPVPPLTDSSGPFPTYFTCRHSFEETLVDEIKHYRPSLDVAAVYPGLVRVEGMSEDDDDRDNDDPMWDPVYALQWLPNCRIVECDNSIKGLARAIASAGENNGDGQDHNSGSSSTSDSNKHFHEPLVGAPRGSLAIHALVPGMCKGQTNPILQRRSYLVAEAVEDIWKKQFPAARKPKQLVTQPKDDTKNTAASDKVNVKPGSKESSSSSSSSSSLLLLQIMLLSPDVAAVSLARCQPTITAGSLASSLQQQHQSWPNPHYPVGMARVDIRDYKMPSSAYRKLLEAFGCWGCKPSDTDTFVDLGASPGGWTAALLLYCDGLLDHDPNAENSNVNSKSQRGGSGIHVYAVDRSPLDRKLMKDPRLTFLQGDAFTFEPKQPVTWMVSDIISYPERIVELVDLWCRKELATNMIITMKFQGSEPLWDQLDQAIQVAESYRYQSRAKHFFNNKNEVTLMLRKENAPTSGSQQSSSSTIPSFYKPVRAAS